MAEEKNLQDVMSDDLFAKGRGEMAEVLNFFEKHAVPMTPRQLAAVAFLDYLDRKNKDNVFKPITKRLMQDRKEMGQPSLFLEVIEKMTLGDRIKGNVRLNKLVEGNGGK